MKPKNLQSFVLIIAYDHPTKRDGLITNPCSCSLASVLKLTLTLSLQKPSRRFVLYQDAPIFQFIGHFQRGHLIL